MTGAHNETKQRIFEAADELFCQSGYDGVSIRDVARHADVNKASVFYYFDSKDDLFEAVLKNYYEIHRRALTEVLASEGTVRERMHRLIDDYWRFMRQNVRYARLIQGLLSAGGQRLEFIERTVGPLYDWTLQALSDIAPDRGPRAARQLYVTFVGAVVNYFTYVPALGAAWGDDPMSEEAIEERRHHLRWLVDMVLDDLIGRES